MRNRTEQVLDAAIEVLGTRGVRQLTHRAVDAAAGLPVGSTSNRYRTREALLVGVLGRILERETTAWTWLAMGTPATDPAVLGAGIGRVLEHQAGADRVLTQARRALFVEAVNQPVLRDEIRRARAELTAWMAPLLAALGSPAPEAHVVHLLALLDGLVGNQVTTDAPGFDPATAITALLRGLAGMSGA